LSQPRIYLAEDGKQAVPDFPPQDGMMECEEESLYENVVPKSSSSAHAVRNSPVSSYCSSSNKRDVPTTNTKHFVHEEESYEKSNERTTSYSSPRKADAAGGGGERRGGRMPHLSVPSDPSLRPPIPPKPTGLTTNREHNLRREHNLQLPIRVVYETFI
jgi:hypothetical protein